MSARDAGDFCWIRIRIFGPQDANGSYRVEAELDDGSWYSHEMKLGDEEEQELIRLSIESSDDYGQYLYDRLLPGELHDAFQTSLGRARERDENQLRVQIWISEECSELHRFRWERLYTANGKIPLPLANWELTPFSRFTRLPIPEPQLDRTDRPLRVLMAVSNPADLGDLEGELAAIDVKGEIISFCEAMREIQDITVTILPGQTGFKKEDLPDDLRLSKFRILDSNTTINKVQEELLKHHVLHFLGHGVFEKGEIRPQTGGDATDQPKPKRDNKRATYLVLEDEQGNAIKVKDEDIVATLAQREESKLPRLIFLASCDTSKFDERNPRPYTSLGPKLVEAGFPAIVAMQDKVPMTVARELTRNFYGSLLKHGVIDLALNQSRWFLYQNSADLKADWTIPVLYMRTPRGRLFSVNRERIALQAIAESPVFRPTWKYGYLPLEAVMLIRDQIKPNWENLVLPSQGQVDLQGQIISLLENFEGKEPLYIAITGQRGTARSTAMKWMVLDTAKKSLDGDSRQQILPVYIELRKCILPAGGVPSYLTLLTESLSEFWPGNLTEKDVDTLLGREDRKFRIFFDHGDDLSDSQRRALLKEISELHASHPAHPCLITMTRGLWDWDQSDVTHILDVQPLSRRRIVRFLFACLETEEKLRREKGELQPSVEESALMQLRRTLEQTQMFDLAGMPWMFVQLIREALAGDFPESRVGVLRNLIEEKARAITTRRGQQARALDTLYALAYRMQMTSQTNLAIKEALDVMQQVRDNREYALEEMLDNLIGQDLLARAGGDAVRFLYPSYQAYCCAQYLCKQNNPKRWEEITAGLGRISHLRRWDDTLTLMAGLAGDPRDLLEKIAYATSLKDGEQVFLAARCLLEAQLNGKQQESKKKPRYVESLVLDALVWRSDSTNEPRSFQRLRAVESLGRLRRLEVVPYLIRVSMEKTRLNSLGKMDFEYGGIRQAAGRALRRLLPPRDKPDNEFSLELRRSCPQLEEVIQKWIRGDAEEIIWLENRMKQPNSAEDDEQHTINDALASMAAFALGDLRHEEAHDKLIEAFLQDSIDFSKTEVIRWAITDALATLDPDKVMQEAILPLIKSGKLNDPVEFSERREQLIYLIGQIRHPDTTALNFVETALISPEVPATQKGRCILALGFLHPPTWKDWKTVFESVALGKFKSIAEKTGPKSHKGIYLRVKALQALAEIGDLETLERLRAERRHWPLELERIFYSTSEEIIWRNNG